MSLFNWKKKVQTVNTDELLGEERIEDEVASGYLSYTKMHLWLIGIIVFLVLCNFCLINGYQALLPLKEVKPVYIGLDMSDDNFVYKLIPVEDIDGQLSIAKFFLRQFIEDWGTVDNVLEENRIDRIHAMTNDEVFNEFKRIRDSNEKDPDTGKPIGLHHIEGFKRKIKILRDAPIAQRGNIRVHEIDFLTEDTNDKNPGARDVHEWNAKIAYVFQPMKIHFEEDGSMLNPSGMIVLENTITHRQEVE